MCKYICVCILAEYIHTAIKSIHIRQQTNLAIYNMMGLKGITLSKYQTKTNMVLKKIKQMNKQTRQKQTHRYREQADCCQKEEGWGRWEFQKIHNKKIQ